MDLVERFINYTKFDTQSSEESTSVPSTAKQLEFAKYLKKELENEGLSDVEMDDMGYIYATLKSNTKKKTPTIGFISHMDTSPDASGKDVKARVIKNYDGNDIELSPGIISSVETFPELKAHKGEDIIVTDGTTLLGADDKAGIAEIVQAMCYLRDHDEIKHGDIRVGFNPDEEIGMGAHHFDVEKYWLRLGLHRRWRRPGRPGIRELQCCRSQDRHQGCERSYRLCQGTDGECKPTGCGIPEHDS